MADTTLNGAIGANDTDITVDDAFSGDADFIIQIDAEFLLVERRGDSLNPQVRRGAFGTTATTHADAADVSVVNLQVQTDAPADPPLTADGDPVFVTAAAAVDPESVTFEADLITSLTAAGLMAEGA